MSTTYDDGVTCTDCWGIVPPEGVQMVPEDGEICRCDEDATLTPYDSGHRAEPKLWVTANAVSATHADDFGKVDFTDDAGETQAVLYLEKNDNGGYTLHVDDWNGDLKVEVTR